MSQVLKQSRETREPLNPCLLKAGFLVVSFIPSIEETSLFFIFQYFSLYQINLKYNLPTYLHFRPPARSPVGPLAHLPACLPAYLSTYLLPTYLFTEKYNNFHIISFANRMEFVLIIRILLYYLICNKQHAATVCTSAARCFIFMNDTCSAPVYRILKFSVFLQFSKIFEPYTKYCLEQEVCREYIKCRTKENDLFRTFIMVCDGILWLTRHHS